MAKTNACDGFAADYSALLDGELEAGRAAQLRAHVEDCAYCEAELEALRGVDPLLRAAPAPAVPTDLRARLQARIAADDLRTGAAARPSPSPGRDARGPQPKVRAPRRPRRSASWVRPAVGIGAAAALAAALVLLLLQPGAREERELSPIVVTGTQGEAPLPPAPVEPVEAPEIQVAVEPEPATVPEAAPETAPERVAEEVILVAEEVPAPPAPVVAEPKPSEEPIEDVLDLDGSSDREVVEIAVALELDTLEDLDVIANLELLERWIALEEDTG